MDFPPLGRGTWFPGSFAVPTRLPAPSLESVRAMLWRVSSPRLYPASFIEPSLPTVLTKAPAGREWIHEIKHDGYRLMVRRDGDRVRHSPQTRNPTNTIRAPAMPVEIGRSFAGFQNFFSCVPASFASIGALVFFCLVHQLISGCLASYRSKGKNREDAAGSAVLPGLTSDFSESELQRAMGGQANRLAEL